MTLYTYNMMQLDCYTWCSQNTYSSSLIGRVSPFRIVCRKLMCRSVNFRNPLKAREPVKCYLICRRSSPSQTYNIFPRPNAIIVIKYQRRKKPCTVTRVHNVLYTSYYTVTCPTYEDVTFSYRMQLISVLRCV